MMFAVSFDVLTNVVGLALPSQCTTDPDTKPVPFTVNVNPAPPGLTASGISGWFMNGTGFCAVAALWSDCAEPSCAMSPVETFRVITAIAIDAISVRGFMSCSNSLLLWRRALAVLFKGNVQSSLT
jgi:hypothetical protein